MAKIIAKKNTSFGGGSSDCVCDGQCLKHNVSFVVCIMQCIPVQSISLSMVARECVFATNNVEEMTQNKQQLLVYYYYGTTIYQFHGKGNRVELPEYLKMAVRALYPNASV